MAHLNVRGLAVERQELPLTENGTSALVDKALKARYVIRLDDACSTMANRPWSVLEDTLSELGIRPIVGVIPDCKDPSLRKERSDPKFWDTVQRWHSKGWAIALHGLHHVYHAHPIGCGSLVPIHLRSEFVGLSLSDQQRIVAKSWALFLEREIQPRFFMAPSHSFDALTLQALRIETDIKWLTDGLSYRPFSRFGFNWLPQQLGRIRQLVPPGVWTTCIHPNELGDPALSHLMRQLRAIRHLVVNPTDYCNSTPGPYGYLDSVFEQGYLCARKLRKFGATSILKKR